MWSKKVTIYNNYYIVESKLVIFNAFNANLAFQSKHNFKNIKRLGAHREQSCHKNYNDISNIVRRQK